MNYNKILIVFILFINNVYAGQGNNHGSLGESLPLISLLPFIGILLSIAFIPLINPRFWHKHFGKVSAFWSFLFIIPFAYAFGPNETIYQILHVLLLEYIPFIVILLSLYTISGGIRLEGTLLGTPIINTLILFIGTVLASWMGTTGAAMLLIRPLIIANHYRKYKVHTVVFFIFLVANIGGSLTPLGDPPLFLGFLSGVHFFWTTKAMFLPMVIASTLLLLIYFAIDSYYYSKKEYKVVTKRAHEKKISIIGLLNILLIPGVIFSVLISGFWKPNVYIPDILGIHIELQNITRDFLLLLFTYISWKYTSKVIREDNAFTWFPIQEVGKLFVGIFITIIPAIAILKAGINGKLGFIIELVSSSDGQPLNKMYFWLTGTLSSLLDNAPTYLVFFNIAGSSSYNLSPANYLMNIVPDTLLAISMGAVFMGAMTYIGNAPNFMVRSIAEENNIPMPSFFGYMLWSILFLVPIYIIITIIIF